MLLDIATAFMTILIIWVLCWGTYKILRESSTPLKLRGVWAAISLTPIVLFMVFHHYHEHFIDHENYWFRGISLLPIIVVMALNNGAFYWFRHKFIRPEPPN